MIPIYTVVDALLAALPDSVHTDKSWDWCWDALGCEAQEQVKEARRLGRAALLELKKEQDGQVKT